MEEPIVSCPGRRVQIYIQIATKGTAYGTKEKNRISFFHMSMTDEWITNIDNPPVERRERCIMYETHSERRFVGLMSL
jgi:hypothetical protein